MKFVIINGSPRRKNTWSAVKRAKNNLDGEFEEIHLMKEKFLYATDVTNALRRVKKNALISIKSIR